MASKEEQADIDAISRIEEPNELLRVVETQLYSEVMRDDSDRKETDIVINYMGMYDVTLKTIRCFRRLTYLNDDAINLYMLLLQVSKTAGRTGRRGKRRGGKEEGGMERGVRVTDVTDGYQVRD